MDSTHIGVKNDRMKGKYNYEKAISIIDKLYKQDYMFENIQYTKETLYYLYVKFLRKSAYTGYPEAEYELGQTYEDINFMGVNPHYSPKKCFHWYTKACENNVAEACNNLATMYESGICCEIDIDKALFLYKKAADLGSENGKKNTKILLRQMKHKP